MSSNNNNNIAPHPPAYEQAAAGSVLVSVTANPTKTTQLCVAADVLVTLTPPTGVKRVPVDICCVVDVSGSMGTEATLKVEGGKTESHGLNLLDVVKHAVTTVANVLGGEDRLAVVAYSTNSRVVLPLTKMDAAGQKSALEEVGLLHPDDMTNMWAGIKDGVELLAKEKASGRASFVFVLTDGQPNVEPARGHVRALEDLCKSLEWRCTVSSFGFGYGINSPLLRDLARVTGGSYVFIPDSSFVGTAFVNAVASALTTVGQQTRVTLTPVNGAKLVGGDEQESIGGHLVVDRNGGAVTLAVGAIGADTPKHICVRMELPPADTKNVEEPFVEVTVDYNSTCGDSKKATQRVALGYARDGGEQVQAQRCRTTLVETVARLADDVKSERQLAAAQAGVQALIGDFEQHKANKLVAALIADLRGQVSEAFQRYDWFARWGKHYLPSLCRSHALEICSNFKDVGLQAYAGALFDEMQRVGDEIFCKLPAPKPAPPPAAELKKLGVSAKQWQAQAPAPAVSMHHYMDDEGPCAHAGALVHMADGRLKRAGDVKRGDWVQTASGGASRVQCVLRTVSRSGTFDLVTLPSGLKLTPYHPVHVDGKWQFPIDVARGQHSTEPCEAVVSFLLEDRAPAMLIENTRFITLAHGLREPVAEHEFFGTERVVDNLRTLAGWRDGLVQLTAGACQVRSAPAPNGRVFALRQ
jgi:hypothetical protein